jgi:hypothetical protein
MAEAVNADRTHFECERCGVFDCSGGAVKALTAEEEVSEAGKPRLGTFESRRRANASGYLRRYPRKFLGSDDIADLCSVRMPDLATRLDELLLRIVKVGERGPMGATLLLRKEDLVGVSWSLGPGEVDYLLDYLVSLGLVGLSQAEPGFVGLKVLVSGWKRVEEIRGVAGPSEQGFVAMWFAEEVKAAWVNGLKPGIEDAGYYAHRVDSKEYPGRVDDEIVAQIRRSRFLVADLTGHRPAVYYEVGFAHGLGLPVFFTCRDDHFAAEKQCFDVRQFNTIKWSAPKELRDKLAMRIEASIGRGPIKPQA